MDGKIPLVFFGSGPVAAASLSGILDTFEIELVVTKRKPSHHRGVAPVEELAEEKSLRLAFADSTEEVDAVLQQTGPKSQIGLVIDYGVIISKAAIEIFPKGIINSHFSLLPEWRGADPITYAILSGQKKTGVSIMLIAERLDEGLLLSQSPYEIPQNTTTPQLTDALVELSSRTLAQVLPLYLEGKINPAPQEEVTLADSKTPSYSHKIKKSDGSIDWAKPAEQIEREIRAYSGWPGSRSQIGDIDCIITAAEVVEGDGQPGSFEIQDKSMVVYTGEKALSIKKLKPAGKKEMFIQEFLNGYGSKLSQA